MKTYLCAVCSLLLVITSAPANPLDYKLLAPRPAVVQTTAPAKSQSLIARIFEILGHICNPLHKTK